MRELLSGYAYGGDAVLNDIWLHYVCYNPRIPSCSYVVL